MENGKWKIVLNHRWRVARWWSFRWGFLFVGISNDASGKWKIENHSETPFWMNSSDSRQQSPETWFPSTKPETKARKPIKMPQSQLKRSHHSNRFHCGNKTVESNGGKQNEKQRKNYSKYISFLCGDDFPSPSFLPRKFANFVVFHLFLCFK